MATTNQLKKAAFDLLASYSFMVDRKNMTGIHKITPCVKFEVINSKKYTDVTNNYIISFSIRDKVVLTCACLCPDTLQRTLETLQEIINT